MWEIEISPDTMGSSVVPQVIPVESFYWTSHLLDRIVDAIEQGKITSGEDWKKIKVIVSLISIEKRTRFYRNLEAIGLSRPSLDYLFDAWTPGSTYPHKPRPATWKVKP